MKARGRKLGIGAAVLAVALVAIGLVALPALGHKVTYNTSLQLKLDTLNDTTEQYSGKVSSTKAACRVGRIITISQSGAPVATATSNSAGDWVTTGPVPPKGADITASTPRKILKKNKKHRHKCAPASTSRRAN